MQRPLKFRQWDILMKRMVPFKDKDDVEITKDGTLQRYMPKNILLQWTGLKDKNGKEIYEGDVVRWIDRGAGWSDRIKQEVVRFEDARFQPFHWLSDMPEIEIIGNIYEHPELLK